MRYRRRENLTVQSVDDELLILDLISNQIHQLNPSASFIWNLCDGTVSTDRMTELYAEHYGIEQGTADSDVRNVTGQLCSVGLLESA
jgi:hypothetical protein